MELPTPEYARWQKCTPWPNRILALLLMVVAGTLPVAVAFYLWGWHGVEVLVTLTGVGSVSLFCFKLALTIFEQQGK